MHYACWRGRFWWTAAVRPRDGPQLGRGAWGVGMPSQDTDAGAAGCRPPSPKDRLPASVPTRPAVPIVLNASERHRLKKMAYGHKTPHQARQRVTVVLLAARGRANARIATEVHVRVDTVRTRRGRFAAGGLPALADRKRSGRPARFTSVQVAEAKSPACQLPAETGTPLSRWSCPELADELTARGITGTVSASTVRRWLHQDAQALAAPVLDLHP